MMAIAFKLLPFVFLLGIKLETLPAVPVITPEQCEYIIKAKENLKLTCKSDANVTWSYSEVLEQLKWDVLNIDVRISREDDLYVAELLITNASGLNVGFYFCNETKNPENVASLYLYVDDDKVLCTNPFNRISVSAEPFQSVVIPCKPTHPSVLVTLYAGHLIGNYTKTIFVETVAKDSEWTYDPTIGFSLLNITDCLHPIHGCAFQKIGFRVKDRRVGMHAVRTNESPTNNITTMRCHQRPEHTFWKFNLSLKTEVHLKWIDSHGKHTQNNQDYTPKSIIWETIFIKRSAFTDKIIYGVEEVTNVNRNKHFAVPFDLTHKPTVQILQDQFHMVNTTETVKCIISGFRIPQISWEFKRCVDDSCAFKPLISSETTGNRIYTSSVAVRSDQSGYIKCIATNKYGSDEQISDYTVTDVKEGFEVLITEDNIKFPARKLEKFQLAAGSQVQLECLATLQNYSSVIDWYFDYRPLYERKDVVVQTGKTRFSVNSSVIIHKIDSDHAGVYTCYTETIPERKAEFVGTTIAVVAPQKPRITVTNMDKHREKIYPTINNFTCFYEAIPRASIKWYKDGLEIFPDNTRVKFQNMKQVLLFIKPNYTTDEGDYTCRVKNRLGSVSRTATLKFSSKPTGNNTPIDVEVGFLLVLLLAIIIPMVYKIKKERVLKQADLAIFENGAVECINQNLVIDDQAQLLPYNKKSWEIPKERIKLGKQLGAGAFGVVMEGVIERYDNDTDLKVAVKMMKRNADDIYLTALLSELKIMVHLGKHLNVVNLIGACTKRIIQGELYVIVEFCRFGNIRNYLLHHRENFINQIDSGTERINYSIGADVLLKPFPVANDDSHADSANNINDDRTNSIYVTEIAEPMTSNKGNKPAMNNISIPLREKPSFKVKPICTKDLLTWAFQVSRGMEYLVSRRVLHGDLASRNILLTANNIVKICDFGLAKRMYKNDNYRKTGSGPLPIKWMSIESMRDNVFSTQSDVWSFGIVLWEFFSLARTPYPGMAADERILQKLVEGYRMDQPTYATKEIYSLMLNCWETDPLNRPTFQRLSDSIGSMLEESVTKIYIDLNSPYLVMNKESIQNGQNDYLQMVSPPDFKTLSSPNHPHHTVRLEAQATSIPTQFF
ncbi:Immunoglobulin [Oryctes borbonicus]|uniref:Immunoglobulin n=1 Tax=Oryctes borbonicus TaxID=1629725 RepID=A0A0T6BAV0_9SCAR|nr:Immunoglobulin [Oryctes borbonicus]